MIRSTKVLMLVLSVMLASSAVHAGELTNPSLSKKERLREIAGDWWIWSLAATLSAGIIVTSVVAATRPGGALADSPASSMAVTIRF